MLALLQAEIGCERVEADVEAGHAGISWINLGEVWYVVARRRGAGVASATIEAVAARVETEQPDSDLVLGAARVKSEHRLSYSDAFAVATARRHDAPLLTGDPEIVALPAVCEVVDLRVLRD